MTLYELIGSDGKRLAIFKSAQQAAETAKRIWPDQEQDPDRTGKGWDVQVATQTARLRARPLPPPQFSVNGVPDQIKPGFALSQGGIHGGNGL